MSQATPRRQARGHADAFPLVATRSTLVGTPPFKELAEGLIEDYYVAAVQPSDPLRSRQQTTLTGSGVCQDSAHTVLALCHWLGLLGRYVSGHTVAHMLGSRW